MCTKHYDRESAAAQALLGSIIPQSSAVPRGVAFRRLLAGEASEGGGELCSKGGAASHEEECGDEDEGVGGRGGDVLLLEGLLAGLVAAHVHGDQAGGPAAVQRGAAQAALRDAPAAARGLRLVVREQRRRARVHRGQVQQRAAR